VKETVVGGSNMAHVACPGTVEAVPTNRPTCGRLRFKCKEHYHDMDLRVAKHVPLMLIRSRAAMYGG
jgi:hypothetical protein